MLLRHLQGLTRILLGRVAALGCDFEFGTGGRTTADPSDAERTRPLLLFIVRELKNRIFRVLREYLGQPGLINVVWNRRWTGERRISRLAVTSDRRRAPRRKPPPPRTWDTLGFVLLPEDGRAQDRQRVISAELPLRVGTWKGEWRSHHIASTMSLIKL